MTTWRTATLGDEIELAYGKSLPERSRLDGPVGVYGSNGVVGHHIDPCVTGPGIVVGRKGSVGEVAYSSGDFWPIDTTYYVVQKVDHNWRFLYHLLRYVDLTGMNSHSTIPGLNREDAYKIEVRLPERAVEDGLASVLDWIERATQLESDAVALTIGLKAAAMRQLFSRGLRGEEQKETEIGPIPSGWRVGPLGHLAEFQRGFDITKSTQVVAGNVPVVSSGGVKSYHNKAAVEGPGVVLGRKGSIGSAYYVESDFWPHDTTLWCRDFNGNVPKFVFYRVQVLDLKRLDSGAANPALNRNFLHAEIISWPGVDEQQEIVDVLDALDRKIDRHRRKRDVLDQLFKSLLHKLMTGEVSVDDLDLSALPKLEGSAP